MSLTQKYPKIFKKINGEDFEEHQSFPFECADGWLWIIDTLCESIQNYIDWNDKPQVCVTQIKEKFGGLRFYYVGGDDTIGGMVWMAERLAYQTCEYCGSMHDIGQTSGWITNICRNCASKHLTGINRFLYNVCSMPGLRGFRKMIEMPSWKPHGYKVDTSE